VRCVAAFLLGPPSLHHHRSSSDPLSANGRELVIVYDQDWSCLHMEYAAPTVARQQRPKESPPARQRLLPTERNVIALWKRAAKCPGERIKENGQSCRLVPSNITLPATAAASMATSGRDNAGSKRDILEYLQAACLMEFLRQHK
jgi:hypothetical protein